MAATKRKGDLAEMKVACDLLEKGYRVAIPFGEDCDYDLVVERDERLERVQVKYARSDDGSLTIGCRSNSLTNGKVRPTKHYTPAMVDWMAVYDAADRCYYVPSHELGQHGRCGITLRTRPTRNNQQIGIRFAEDYGTLDGPGQKMFGEARDPE